MTGCYSQCVVLTTPHAVRSVLKNIFYPILIRMDLFISFYFADDDIPLHTRTVCRGIFRSERY